MIKSNITNTNQNEYSTLGEAQSRPAAPHQEEIHIMRIYTGCSQLNKARCCYHNTEKDYGGGFE